MDEKTRHQVNSPPPPPPNLPPPCQDARPAVFAVFADFGVDDGFGLAQASAAGLRRSLMSPTYESVGFLLLLLCLLLLLLGADRC